MPCAQLAKINCSGPPSAGSAGGRIGGLLGLPRLRPADLAGAAIQGHDARRAVLLVGHDQQPARHDRRGPETMLGGKRAQLVAPDLAAVRLIQGGNRVLAGRKPTHIKPVAIDRRTRRGVAVQRIPVVLRRGQFQLPFRAAIGRFETLDDLPAVFLRARCDEDPRAPNNRRGMSRTRQGDLPAVILVRPGDRQLRSRAFPEPLGPRNRVHCWPATGPSAASIRATATRAGRRRSTVHGMACNPC